MDKSGLGTLPPVKVFNNSVSLASTIVENQLYVFYYAENDGMNLHYAAGKETQTFQSAAIQVGPDKFPKNADEAIPAPLTAVYVSVTKQIHVFYVRPDDRIIANLFSNDDGKTWNRGNFASQNIKTAPIGGLSATADQNYVRLLARTSEHLDTFALYYGPATKDGAWTLWLT